MSAHDPRCMGCPECDVEWRQRKRKAAIIEALRKFVNQRPGFEPCNYGDAASYRSDQRTALRQRTDALRLLRDIELRDSITAEDIMWEAGSGGRLTLVTKEKNGATWYGFDYCTGQYFPTEFRGAAARLCASILWTWKREHCMPQVGAAPVGSGKAEAGMYWDGKRAVSAGDWLRASFRREFGRTLANRYFN